MAIQWTQAEYDALKAAVATGATRVTYADRTVEYGSQSEMQSLLDRMARSLSIQTDDRFSLSSFSRD